MKAVQLVPAMEEGGVERYITALNRILVEHGWENSVISSGGKLEFDIRGDSGRTQNLDLKSKNPFTAVFRAWKLRKLILAEKPDVVVAHSRVPAWLFVIARVIHNFSFFIFHFSFPPFPRFLTYAHGANSVSRYSRVMTAGEIVMCPSNFIKEYLMKAYGTPAEKFRVIPHAVDFERFDPADLDQDFIAAKRAEWGIRPGDKVVMCVGRITPLKGLDNLIEELGNWERGMGNGKEENGELGMGNGGVKLIVVGGAEKKREAYFESLKKKVSALPLPPSSTIVFAGAQNKIPECLSIADVVVSANVTKPESFGLSMAEALAMGKPVVAKGFGGALDIVRDGVDGVLCDRGGFAAAIEKALTLDTANIRADAMKRFDFGVMSERTMSVYDAAISYGK